VRIRSLQLPRSLKIWIPVLALAPWTAMGQASSDRDLSAKTGVSFRKDASKASSDIHVLNSADSAVEMALRYHPRTRALFAEAALARAERSEGRVLPNPEADFALLKNGDESHWELGIMGDVNGLLLYPWRRRASNVRYNAALSRLASEISRQKSDIRNAWYRAVAAGQTEAFMAQTSAIWEAAAELARRQREAGTMNALDLAEVEAAAAESRLELRSAQSNTIQEKENLAGVLGLPASNWSLPESLPSMTGRDPSLSELESMAASRNTGLIAAREEAEAGEKAHRLSWLEVLPSLKAGVSIEQENGGSRFIGPAISAEIPIFDLGIPKRARTRAQRDLGRLHLASAEAEIGPEIRRHFHAMTSSRRNHEETLQTLVPLRERATAEALRQYNFMLTGVYRLLTSRREELAAHKMAVETLRDYWTERAELERLIGGALPASSMSSSEPSSTTKPTESHHHGAEQ
jgi:cobalt-zinc-cadmium efflux system outer membrane protein